MRKQLLGVILCSAGSGMLIYIFVPGWGFFIAVGLVVCGGLLISSKC